MERLRFFVLNAKLGTFLSGVFTIFVTYMHMVFEAKYMRDNNCTTENKEKEINFMDNFVICSSFKIILYLSIITILVSFFLLYSVYAQIYQGMVTYVFWIIFYESVDALLNCLSTTIPNVTSTEEKFLRWFGLVSRIILYGFWTFFVINYAQIVYKDQMQNYITSYSRRLSNHPESKRERLPYPNFPKLDYPPRIYIK